MTFNHNIPAPAEKRLALHVNIPAERNLRDGHPWLFEGAIESISHDGRPGDLAVIFDRKNRFLAIGLYDPTSPIRVRILQANEPAKINEEWFEGKLQAAAKLRRPLSQNSQTTAYRLVHGENDGLPGLVVDRYAENLVISLDTPAWIPYLPMLLPKLERLTFAERYILRLSRTVEQAEKYLYGLTEGQVLDGPPLTGPVEFLENGIRFTADLVQGQKTGFFLDQRENRARVESLIEGNSAIKTVLNVFAYTGGFSLYAARGGANAVTSVELSRPALETAETNFKLNRDDRNIANTRHEPMVGDAFEVMEILGEAGYQFDMVIIDPPSFARRKGEEAGALAAYSSLVKLGLNVLRPQGTLVTCSCSSRIPAADFYDMVHKTASRVGRPITEIGRSAHPLDHPISFEEGAYLKCLYAVA